MVTSLLANRVRVTVQLAPGVADFQLGLPIAGHQTFAAAGVTNGATVRYGAEGSDNSQWEVGQGVYNSATQVLTRPTIYSSSNGGAKVNFTTPHVEVWIDATKETFADLFNLTVLFNALGDIVYGTGPAAATTLPGNITTQRQYLTETGTGSAANAPAWNQLRISDDPAPALGGNLNPNGFGVTAAWNPSAAGGSDLGTAALPWGNLWLKSGGQVNWGNGQNTIVGSSGGLTFTIPANDSFWIQAPYTTGQTGPYIQIYGNRSNPAANDIPAAVTFLGNDSTGTVIDYTDLISTILSPTHGATSSMFQMSVMNAGAYIFALTLGTTYTDQFTTSSAHIFDTGGGSAAGTLVLKSSTTDVFGPFISLFHNKNAAVNDTPGYINFNGKNSVGSNKRWAFISAGVNSPTNASETTNIAFGGYSRGTPLTFASFDGSRLYGATTNFTPRIRLQADTTWYVGATPATITMTIASPAVVSWTAHGLSAGDGVRFSTTGALPTGVTQGLLYFVLATGLTANSFQFALSPGGTAINTSGSQSGVHSAVAGNDNNDGSAADHSHAWATIQHAWDWIAQNVDLNAYNAIIQLADGWHDVGNGNPQALGIFSGATGLSNYVSLIASPIGSATDGTNAVVIRGHVGDKTKVTLTSSAAIWATIEFDATNCALVFDYLMLRSEGTNGVIIGNYGTATLLFIKHVDFSGPGGWAHIDGAGPNNLSFENSYSITSNANPWGCHVAASEGGIVGWSGFDQPSVPTANSLVITLSGVQAWSTAFIQVVNDAVVIANPNTAAPGVGVPGPCFSGTSTGPRFYVSQGGVLQLGGNGKVNTLPGNSPGSVGYGGNLNGGALPAPNNFGSAALAFTTETPGSETCKATHTVLSAGARLDALTLGTTDPASLGFAQLHQFTFSAVENTTLRLTNANPGQTGPAITVYHNSASPAANDIPFAIYVYGKNSLNNNQSYGDIFWSITNATSGSQASSAFFDIQAAGANLTALTLGTTDAFGNYAHVFDFGPNATGPDLTVQCSGSGPAIGTLYASNGATGNVGFFSFGGKLNTGATWFPSTIIANVTNATSGTQASKLNFSVFTTGGANSTIFTLQDNIAGFTGPQFLVTGAFQDFTIQNTGATGGSYLKIYHNPATAVACEEGRFAVIGKTSTGVTITSGAISVNSISVTNGSDSSNIAFLLRNAGAAVTILTLNPGNDAEGDYNIATFNGGGNQWSSLEITNTHSSSGPGIVFYQNATGVAANVCGYVDFDGKNASGAFKGYAAIGGNIVTPTAASETGSLTFRTIVSGATATRVTIQTGMQIGSPTGGDKGAGTLNVSSGVFLNGTAYTNPDYALEHHYTGKIEQFASNPGASKYLGLMPLDDVDEYLRENYRLPGIHRECMDIFERADVALEKIEQAWLYIVELRNRNAELRERVAVLEGRLH